MKEERFMVDRRGSQWKKYAGYGFLAFLVLAAVVVLVFMFVRNEDFSEITGKIWKALKPVVVGACFAYLMNPIMVFIEKGLRRVFYKFAKKITRANKAARAISIVLTVLFVLLIIAVLMYLLIPQLIETIKGIIDGMPEQIERVTEWYYSLELEETVFAEYIELAFVKGTEYVEDLVQNRLVSTATNVLTSVATGVKNVFGFLYNTVIGLIFSIYLLANKEKLAGIAKKILFATFKRKRANRILRITRACHIKCIGSFTGKAVDSVIIGLLCFVAMVIMDLPYATLISVFVGVTNVIPFFGPFIGAIPSAILIFFFNPIQVIYFGIMILILQQFDGNILTPKIVGDTIGLSPLWVLFACTFFGSLWGIIGMLIGVPIMACIYMIIKEIVEDKLHDRGLTTDTDEYIVLDYVDETELFRKEVETDKKISDKGLTPEELGIETIEELVENRSVPVPPAIIMSEGKTEPDRDKNVTDESLESDILEDLEADSAEDQLRQKSIQEDDSEDGKKKIRNKVKGIFKK